MNVDALGTYRLRLYGPVGATSEKRVWDTPEDLSTDHPQPDLLGISLESHNTRYVN